MTNKKDAFDLWWAWAQKPPHSPLTIPAAIHDAVMALPPDERRDPPNVNEARSGCAQRAVRINTVTRSCHRLRGE